jgi:hypothetical protein
LVTRANTFLLGNVNVFFDAQPHEEWRGLLEARFTNLPHGEELSFASPAGPYERVDTESSDYTSGTARNNVVLGSTIIERAWAEWKRPEFISGYDSPDAYQWDTYLFAPYRLPWWGLEPYGYFEFIHAESFVCQDLSLFGDFPATCFPDGALPV